MEVAEPMEVSVDPLSEEAFEMQLIKYLQNIIKVQIMPMKYTTLRELVAVAPKKSQLLNYVQVKYPDIQFLDFLNKYPAIFTVNRDRTVVLTVGNSFTRTLPIPDRSPDVVDGHDTGEYISGSEESSEGEADLSDSEEESLPGSPSGDRGLVRTVANNSVL